MMDPKDDVNSNFSIRDELENYGSHLTVVVEEKSGRVRYIENITTRDYGNGPVVVIETGNPYGE